MKRVIDPADPNRCQGAAQDGQCMNESESGSDYCQVHGGRDKGQAAEKRLYYLAEAQSRARLAGLSEHEEVKSLREEIAIARIILERRLNLIRNEADWISSSGPLNTCLLTIERLVKSAHTLEQNLGSMLSKATVLRLGQQICEIVIDELKDVPDFEPIVDRITDRMIATIAATQNAELAK